MSDEHPVRTAIIGTTVGGLLVTLILWALGFVGIFWRGLWSAVSWAFHLVTTSFSMPAWLGLVVAAYAVTVTVLLRKRGALRSRPLAE